MIHADGEIIAGALAQEFLQHRPAGFRTDVKRDLHLVGHRRQLEPRVVEIAPIPGASFTERFSVDRHQLGDHGFGIGDLDSDVDAVEPGRQTMHRGIGTSVRPDRDDDTDVVGEDAVAEQIVGLDRQYGLVAGEMLTHQFRRRFHGGVVRLGGRGDCGRSPCIGAAPLPIAGGRHGGGPEPHADLKAVQRS